MGLQIKRPRSYFQGSTLNFSHTNTVIGLQYSKNDINYDICYYCCHFIHNFNPTGLQWVPVIINTMHTNKVISEWFLPYLNIIISNIFSNIFNLVTVNKERNLAHVILKIQPNNPPVRYFYIFHIIILVLRKRKSNSKTKPAYKDWSQSSYLCHIIISSVTFGKW